MELRQLRYFVTLAEELNFSRAAVLLHMTQPPLTRQMQQLEQTLGVKLLERTNRGVTLTDSGQTFLEEARRLLCLADQAVERTRLADRGAIGRMDVAVFGSAILDVIPQMLQHFHARFPNVVVALHTLGRNAQIRALREGRLTIAFNRFLPHEPDMVVETVLHERLCVALPQAHPLAEHVELTLAELTEEAFILFPNRGRPSLADEVVALCRAQGFEPLVAQETSDVLSCIALVATGFGISLVPNSTTNLKLAGVRYVPLAEPTPVVELNCMYRKDDASPILKAFLEILHGFRSRQIQEEAT